MAVVPAAVREADWPQWGRDPQHTGFIDALGQRASRILDDIVYDPFVAREMADRNAEGALLVHYQAPLVDGDDVFMVFKSGQFSSMKTWETQQWIEKRLHWENGRLVEQWSFTTNWVPVPFGSTVSGNGPFWEPVFHPVLANNAIYVPCAGGTIMKLDRASGVPLADINPFGSGEDPTIFVASPLSSDAAGNVYYNAIQLSPGRPWDDDVVNSWLVKVAPDGSTTKATYTSILASAAIKGAAPATGDRTTDIESGALVPAAGDACDLGFSTSQLPWPPSPDAQTSTTACGSQRPGVNVAPAIAADGTIYTVTRAHLVTRYNYLIAVNPDLSGKWAASLRGRLHDGCREGRG